MKSIVCSQAEKLLCLGNCHRLHTSFITSGFADKEMPETVMSADPFLITGLTLTVQQPL